MRRGLLRPLVLPFLLLLLALGGGFWAFLLQLERDGALPEATVDGVVVLTGGPDRIVDGADILASGRAKRLLITGVNTNVTYEHLARQLPRFKAQFECCIDIDYLAQNTVGNAQAARQWATEKAYKSLIVVTSNYHLPRAILEFRRAMPDMQLHVHGVVSERVDVDSWWRNPQIARLVIVEYGKFVVAWGRFHLANFGIIRDTAPH